MNLGSIDVSAEEVCRDLHCTVHLTYRKRAIWRLRLARKLMEWAARTNPCTVSIVEE
ncbi:MAG TPA: hypothetical protein VMX15_00970 [Candidatus Heimdallarchaeota archaeon]|nr:hypothetical protein [Candidatus Heimdallarchaeota archaeon]